MQYFLSYWQSIRPYWKTMFFFPLKHTDVPSIPCQGILFSLIKDSSLLALDTESTNYKVDWVNIFHAPVFSICACVEWGTRNEFFTCCRWAFTASELGCLMGHVDAGFWLAHGVNQCFFVFVFQTRRHGGSMLPIWQGQTCSLPGIIMRELCPSQCTGNLRCLYLRSESAFTCMSVDFVFPECL